MNSPTACHFCAAKEPTLILPETTQEGDTIGVCLKCKYNPAERREPDPVKAAVEERVATQMERDTLEFGTENAGRIALASHPRALRNFYRRAGREGSPERAAYNAQKKLNEVARNGPKAKPNKRHFRTGRTKLRSPALPPHTPADKHSDANGS